MVFKPEQKVSNLINPLFEGDIDYIHNNNCDALNKAYDVLFNEVLKNINIPNNDAT